MRERKGVGEGFKKLKFDWKTITSIYIRVIALNLGKEKNGGERKNYF
jgi:hypothetical protein